MEHANIVRGGNRLGDIDQKMQTSVEGDFVESTLRHCPFRQVRPGIFAFEKVRRRLEIPFQNADKFRPVAERFPQETRNSDLAFQSLQANAIRRELEYPLFVSLGIFGQPDFARSGDIHGARKPPLLSSRNDVARFESKLGPCCRRDRLAIDRHSQPIADARNRDNRGVVFVPHGLAQLGNGRRQRTIHHHHIGPDGFQ